MPSKQYHDITPDISSYNNVTILDKNLSLIISIINLFLNDPNTSYPRIDFGLNIKKYLKTRATDIMLLDLKNELEMAVLTNFPTNDIIIDIEMIELNTLRIKVGINATTEDDLYIKAGAHSLKTYLINLSIDNADSIKYQVLEETI